MPKTINTHIEKATKKHYAVIAQIYNEHIKIGTATMEETIHSADMIAAWVAKFNSRERLFVLTKKEIVIGWGIIKRYSERRGYRYACETAVYLAQSEVGKGYGTVLKKRLIQECRALNYHHMVAKIFANNTASIHYNLKLGYQIVGQQKEIGFRNGQWLDVVIMQLVLNNK